MRGSSSHTTILVLGITILCTKAASIAYAPIPYATVTGEDDGTTYSFFRTTEPITATEASNACAMLGGELASMTSPEQVRGSVWSDEVADAITSSETEPIWLGIKISWPKPSSGRRMLRGLGLGGSEAAGAADGDSDEHEEHIKRLLKEMDASDRPVPTTTNDGRRIPQLLRLWIFEKQQQDRHRHSLRRGLLGRQSGSDESTVLRDATLTWADGSNADFVLSNPANMGFLACNTKKYSECCGAVYDIGLSAYPGAEFPAIFFYPCDTLSFSVTPPSGYACAVNPVAELQKPQPTTAGGGKTSAPTSPSPSCSPGSSPSKAEPWVCKPCRRNTYSTDGLKCKKCPEGQTAPKGATKCS